MSLFSFRGRETRTLPDADRYIATVRIAIDANSRYGHVESDLRCVVERAATAAAQSYALAGAQIATVTVESIEPECA